MTRPSAGNGDGRDDLADAVESFVAAGTRFVAGCTALLAGARAASRVLTGQARTRLEQLKKKAGG